MKKSLFLLICVGKVTLSAQESCKDISRVVGDCQKVSGRISYTSMTNAYPRLWPVGTKRLKSITLETNSVGLITKRVDLHTEAWGTFSYCPLEKEVPGKSQPICLQDATNITYKKQ